MSIRTQDDRIWSDKFSRSVTQFRGNEILPATLQQFLSQPAPDNLQSPLPRHSSYTPSPQDWRDEVLYFLLVDRFSDGLEHQRPLVSSQNREQHRPANFRWDAWFESGASRFQGGTLRGVATKLDYLKNLGITTLWLSPVFKQPLHENSYHGYGIQDFLEVDPRFGSRSELVDLIQAAHQRGIRVILDIIFNHSGPNWVYPEGTPGGIWTPKYNEDGRYSFGNWVSSDGSFSGTVQNRDSGVWPRELQNHEFYTRAGRGDLGSGRVDDPFAENKRCDFLAFRDFRTLNPQTLATLAACYKYWITITDCDGFRIDTLKHVDREEARAFCGEIKEYAHQLGKSDFFLVGEVAGGDFFEDYYLDALDKNLNACLDLAESRMALRQISLGENPSADYFDLYRTQTHGMGSHRVVGKHHVSVLDDHDHVSGRKTRMASEVEDPNQVVAATALQLFSLGIPCIYYGTEQALSGPEPGQRHWLENWGGSDVYLREAMFGPTHPRASGSQGLANTDPGLPGFGPWGTSGAHCFEEQSPTYVKLSQLLQVRKERAELRSGRQYQRPVSLFGSPFVFQGPGELTAWSRILSSTETLCLANAGGDGPRGGRVIVDGALNHQGSKFTVIASTSPNGPSTGDRLEVKGDDSGTLFLDIPSLPPGDVLIVTNRP